MANTLKLWEKWGWAGKRLALKKLQINGLAEGKKICEKAFSEIRTRICRCIFNTLLMNRAATHYLNVSVVVFNFLGMEHIYLLVLGLRSVTTKIVTDKKQCCES